MLDVVHKTFLLGLGLAAITRDKIDAHVKELVEKGKLSEKDGRELAQEMLEKSDEMKKDFQEKVEKCVEDTLQKLNIATKSDIEALADRVEKLETRE